MGKVDAFEIEGCVCTFYSNDHPPPHFHVKAAGEWEIKVFFLVEPVEYAVEFEIKRIPGRTLRAILELAAEHRQDLFREWGEKVLTDRG